MHILVLFQKRDIKGTVIITNKKLNGRRKKQGIDDLMNALTNQHYAAVSMLTKHQNNQDRSTPVDVSVSSSKGSLQLSVDVGIEKGTTIDIQKSISAVLEMAIVDSFNCENLLDMAVESNCCCKILDVAKFLV